MNKFDGILKRLSTTKTLAKATNSLNLTTKTLNQHQNHLNRTMLDYYGSITKQSEEVKADLLSAFTVAPLGQEGEGHAPYEKAYIEGLIEDLAILDQDYSVSGWAFFHFKDCCDLIEAQIQRDMARAELSEKRLVLGTRDEVS